MSDLKSLEELLKLSNHYAELLNLYDGGERRTFSSIGAWILRLKELEKPKSGCPTCGGRGRARQGPHFDHERRCGDCNVIWIPS